MHALGLMFVFRINTWNHESKRFSDASPAHTTHMCTQERKNGARYFYPKPQYICVSLTQWQRRFSHMLYNCLPKSIYFWDWRKRARVQCLMAALYLRESRSSSSNKSSICPNCFFFSLSLFFEFLAIFNIYRVRHVHFSVFSNVPLKTWHKRVPIIKESIWQYSTLMHTSLVNYSCK